MKTAKIRTYTMDSEGWKGWEPENDGNDENSENAHIYEGQRRMEGMGARYDEKR